MSSDRCPYCFVDDGEGHTVICWFNNEQKRRAEIQKTEPLSQTEKLLTEIRDLLTRTKEIS
jgi:hypothetical protein